MVQEEALDVLVYAPIHSFSLEMFLRQTAPPLGFSLVVQETRLGGIAASQAFRDVGKWSVQLPCLW